MVTTIRLPPVVTTKNVYPTINPDWLTCMVDPVIPAKDKLNTDTDIPYPTLEDAWHDCWSKLNKIRELVATWPKD